MSKASCDLFVLRWSTAMPTVAANFGEILAALSSASEKPRPNLTLALCCCVWHLTKGLSLSAGPRLAGARLSRDFFLPGWLNQDLMWAGLTALPLGVEVLVGDDLVVLDHLCCLITKSLFEASRARRA